MKTFLNDSDGLSLFEFMSLLIMGAWVAITVVLFVMIIKGSGAAEMMIEFYKSFLYVPATVAGGMFLQGSAKELTARRQAAFVANGVYGKNETYDYTDYGTYSEENPL